MTVFDEFKINFQNIVSSKLFQIILLISVAFILYHQAILGPFIFDDEQFILKNQAIQNFNLKEIYASNVTQSAFLVSNFYRPHSQLVYAILHSFFGLNPIVFHIAPIFFHALNACLLLGLFPLLSFGRTATFLIAFIMVFKLG